MAMLNSQRVDHNSTQMATVILSRSPNQTTMVVLGSMISSNSGGGMWRPKLMSIPQKKCIVLEIPSGNLLHSYRKWPFISIEIVDLPIENGGSFHSYVNVDQRVSHSTANSQAQTGMDMNGLWNHRQ